MDSIAYAISGGWAAGISAYATVLVLGLVGRAGLTDVPHVLQRTDVLVVVGVLAAIELVADKIPYIDSLWDTVHTVLRPIVAVVIGWSLARDASTTQQVATALLAGGTALLSHAGKAGIRLAVNASPGAAPNIAVSTAEDALLIGVLLLATQHPWFAAGTAVSLVAISLGVGAVLAHRVRRGWQNVRQRYFTPTDRHDPNSG